MESTGKPVKKMVSPGSFLVILLMGSNEVMAFLALGMLVFLYFQEPYRATRIVLMAAVAGFLAPGNFNRMGTSADPFYMKWLKRIVFFGINTLYVSLKVFLVLSFS